MTFLNPALLFGLLAASIPVLIHLLNLKKLKKIEFSTLRFLKELQKNKIRKIKIKQWLLLALRVLIILLMVTAFARPTLEGVSIGGAASSAKTTAIFILDDTFSMSFVDQNGSNFNQAKEKIKTLLTQFEEGDEGDEVGLILVSNPEKETELTTNLAKFINELNDVQISYQTNELHNSILEAAKLVSESKNFNKEIYLFTDFQKGRLADKKNLTSVENLFDKTVRLYSFDFSGAKIYNNGINSLKINSQLLETGKPIQYEVIVTNYSEKIAENLVLSLFINGERFAQRSINLNAGETKTIELEATAKQIGYQEVTAEIEIDDINFDNNAYTSFYIPDKINVLLIYDELSDANYTELALKSANQNQRIEVTLKKNNLVTISFINKFDVVIIIGTKSKSNIEALKEFIGNGGGILIFPGENDDLNSFVDFLKTMDLPKPMDNISIINNQLPFEFDEVDFNHPVFKNIFVNEEKKEVESARIYSYFNIKTEGKGRSVISLADGSSFLSEYKIDNGKVLLFNSSPVLGKSDFPLKSIFAPLINKSVQYLSSKEKQEESYIAGENIFVDITNLSLPQLKIVYPDNNEELIDIDKNSGSQFVTFNNTKIAGNYKFYSGDKLFNIISINVNPLESNTVVSDEDEFDEYLSEIEFKGTHIKIQKDENPLQLIMQARFGSELWRYFLLAALLIALIEMAVARNTKKEIVELNI